MGNYLKMAQQQQIQALVALGWSDRQIAATLGIDRGSVRKYRRPDQNPPKVPADQKRPEGQNQPEVPTDPMAWDQQEVPAERLPALPPTNSAQLRPFVGEVRKAHLRRATAQRIYQDLVETHGYAGSYDSVKRYVRKLRKQHRRFRERLPHLPGREAQVDFGKSTALVRINGRYKRVWFFKMTLPCSKHAYEELVERQDLETFLRCHERAFEFFGGVPEIVTIDNLKSGVIAASLYEPIVNETYLAFASHWGFAANPCIPATPEHKGVVERDVGYTKHNALEGRRFESVEEGNATLRHWNKRWARTRIHGTTKCQVWKLFCELERPALHALAPKPFEYFTAEQRKVDVNGCIEVEARYYAVPPKFVGDVLVVHFNQHWVKAFSDGVLVVTHRRLQQKGKVSDPLPHCPEWRHPSLESQERYYLRVARKTGPCMHAVVFKILADSHPLSIRRVRGMLWLTRRFGSAIAEEAAERISRVSVYSYRMMRIICEQIRDGTSVEKNITQQHELIRPLDEYESLVAERTI